MYFIGVCIIFLVYVQLNTICATYLVPSKTILQRDTHNEPLYFNIDDTNWSSNIELVTGLTTEYRLQVNIIL